MAAIPFSLLHPEDDEDRLRALGITTEELRKAVERGIIERMNCTMFDPPSYPGVVQWARTVRDLRETLVPKGWRADNTRNFSTVVSPNDLVAFSVSTGDERTGYEGEPEPRTKYPKGTVFLAAVNRNVQLDLFGELVVEVDGTVSNKTRTWTLLMRTDAKAKEVRVELSRPSQIGVDGRVNAWSQRILFTPFSIDDTLPGDDDPPIEGIDVPVEPII